MTQDKALQEAKDRVAKRYSIPVPEHSEMYKTGIKDVECSGWEQLLNHVREGKNRNEIIDKLTNEAMLEYASSKDKEIEELKKQSNQFFEDYERLRGEKSILITANVKLQQQLQSSSGERQDGEIVYRKVSVKERLPEVHGKTGKYFMCIDDRRKEEGIVCEGIILPLHSEIERTKQEFYEKCTHWLEPISTPPPTKQSAGFGLEEIRKAFDAARDQHNVGKRVVEFEYDYKNADEYIASLPHQSTKQFSFPTKAEMNTLIIIEFPSDCYDIAERAIELYRSEIIRINSPFPSEHTEVKEGEGREVELVEYLKEALPFFIQDASRDGRAGCTYGDTKYDSLSAHYGMKDAYQHILNIMKKYLNQPPKD